MPQQPLVDAFAVTEEMPWSMLLLRLGLALVLGCVVGAVYRLTHGRSGDGSVGLTATLVLLSVLIAMVTLVIGNSVARAFSLVGALAIVRFRTVVEDTRDTAFVIFAVAVGMAAGAGALSVPLVGIPLAALAAFLFRPAAAAAAAPAEARDCDLRIRIGFGHDPEGLLGAVLDQYIERRRLTAAATARQGAAIDLSYGARLRQGAAVTALIAELHRLDGVLEVELQQP